MYVARDKNNDLYLYKELLIREENTEQFCINDDNKSNNTEHGYDFLKLDNNLFPDVKWEDEPQEVMLVKVK